MLFVFFLKKKLVFGQLLESFNSHQRGKETHDFDLTIFYWSQNTHFFPHLSIFEIEMHLTIVACHRFIGSIFLMVHWNIGTKRSIGSVAEAARKVNMSNAWPQVQTWDSDLEPEALGRTLVAYAPAWQCFTLPSRRHSRISVRLGWKANDLLFKRQPAASWESSLFIYCVSSSSQSKIWVDPWNVLFSRKTLCLFM